MHCAHVRYAVRLNGFLLKMNHAGARAWMAECGSVSRFSNLKANRPFLPFLCNCCCCPLLPCRTSLSNVTSEPRLESRAYYGKTRAFDPRFLARKAKLDSINSISQNPHGWTSILGKLSVDPRFPLRKGIGYTTLPSLWFSTQWFPFNLSLRVTAPIAFLVTFMFTVFARSFRARRVLDVGKTTRMYISVMAAPSRSV